MTIKREGLECEWGAIQLLQYPSADSCPRQRPLLSFVCSSYWKVRGSGGWEKGIYKIHNSENFKWRIVVAEEVKVTMKKKETELAAAAGFNKCEISYNMGIVLS